MEAHRDSRFNRDEDRAGVDHARLDVVVHHRLCRLSIVRDEDRAAMHGAVAHMCDVGLVRTLYLHSYVHIDQSR